VGEAIADIITGTVNPSGKLAETFPRAMDDFPVDDAFPGGLKQVVYQESLDIGYRAVHRLNLPVLFPFGHGLSYSSFAYIDVDAQVGENSVQLTLTLENTSEIAGAEVVQVYGHYRTSNLIRSTQFLTAYHKVFLKARETQTLTLDIPFERFKVTHQGTSVLEKGDVELHIGASSADIKQSVTVSLPGETFEKTEGENKNLFEALYGKSIPKEIPVKPYTLNSTLNDISTTYIGKKMYQKIQKEMATMFVGDYDETLKMMFENMVREMPLRQLISMSNGVLTLRKMKGLIALMNKRFLQAMKYLLF